MRAPRRAALVTLAAGVVAVGLSAATPDDAAVRGALYLVAQQESSGAFFTPDARADGVAEVVASLVAGGVGGASVDRALGYIRKNGSVVASKPAYAGRIVMGIVAGGGDPRRFGGVDYVARIKPDSKGAYDPNLYGHALSALGVLAARERLPEKAMQHIRNHQCPDGGYAYDPGCALAGSVQTLKSNVDTTSLVLCVLVASGIAAADSARAGAQEFLSSAVNGERGFGEYAGESTNANSTGLALAAIAAIDESPESTPWRSGVRDPAQALRALQMSSGGFKLKEDQAEVNNYATVQAVPGLARAAYPVWPRRAAGPRPGAAVPGSTEAHRASAVASSIASPSDRAPIAPATETAVAAAASGASGVKQRHQGGSGRGLVVPLAIGCCAGVVGALWRLRRRWAGTRAR